VETDIGIAIAIEAVAGLQSPAMGIVAMHAMHDTGCEQRVDIYFRQTFCVSRELRGGLAAIMAVHSKTPGDDGDARVGRFRRTRRLFARCSAKAWCGV
jgi:hypothetical protein